MQWIASASGAVLPGFIRSAVSRQQIATLENPDSNWRISTRLRVAEALGLELDVALVKGSVSG